MNENEEEHGPEQIGKMDGKVLFLVETNVEVDLSKWLCDSFHGCFFPDSGTPQQPTIATWYMVEIWYVIKS